MDPLVFKIISAVVIIATALIGGYLPVRMKSWKNSEQFIRLGNALSGGVFLGAGMLHMLAEANHQWQDLFPGEFPWINLLALVGFGIVLYVERVWYDHQTAGSLTGEAEASVPVILLVILSIHSVLAGTALGLESTLFSTMIVFLAIIAHKLFAAFALGISMQESKVTGPVFKRRMITFALMTPLGIVVGTALSQILESNAALIIEALFSAVAAGTFIYVAVLEIIDDVFATPKGNPLDFVYARIGLSVTAKSDHRLNFLFMGFGIAIMAFLAIFG